MARPDANPNTLIIVKPLFLASPRKAVLRMFFIMTGGLEMVNA